VSRLSLLNRDWKSQISEENSVISSPNKKREVADKIVSSRKIELAEQKRPNSYHTGKEAKTIECK
jgi:hypothetical protein